MDVARGPGPRFFFISKANGNRSCTHKSSKEVPAAGEYSDKSKFPLHN